MVNYREILRLSSLSYSQRQIAASTSSSRDTISEVLRLVKKHGLEWPLPEAFSNQAIQDLFHPERKERLRRIPDYDYIHKELARPGVTLTLLWAEYTAVCNAENAIPYQLTQFCENYRSWARSTKATMRINRKPGDLMEVDWAGNTLTIHDSTTGEAIDAYLFVAVLPCSCYAYVEAFRNMKTENWIEAHVHAYRYFGGSTRILVPDNLKTGVIKNTRNELHLNRSYQEMAEYYDTAVIPARVKSPQDKPNAEGTVNHTSTWIVAALRNEKFFSIKELNEAIFEKLEAFNSRPFQKREGSRLSAFQSEEKEFLKPLPASPYELAVWSTAFVHNDYLISDGKNKYSVPFDLIGQEVSVRLTSTTVEAFFNGSRVSSHPREEKKLRHPIIKIEHMPDNHKKYLSYNKEAFLEWAQSIGPNTTQVAKSFLESGKVAEQGYKSCASLTNMADKYSFQRLENACERALSITRTPSIKTIRTILQTGQDKVKKEDIPESSSRNEYAFTRGAAYFKGGAYND
jgi:transposase